MTHNISKICADSLRKFTKEKYDIKLKSTHAHELVAAFFGYSSKNALLADKKHSVSNLRLAKIVVMTPDNFIDQRRLNLEELSSELPNNYILGEAIYTSLFTDEWWMSPYPPFRSYFKAAQYLVENNDTFQAKINLFKLPMHHVVGVQITDEEVTLHVFHAYEKPTDETLVGGKTTIKLTRVAGHIGYTNPRICVERWTAGARRTLKSLGVAV